MAQVTSHENIATIYLLHVLICIDFSCVVVVSYLLMKNEMKRLIKRIAEFIYGVIVSSS